MPTILAIDTDAAQIAARLLAVTDDPARVKVDTSGKYIGFSVDDEIAAAAGYVVSDDDTETDTGGSAVPDSVSSPAGDGAAQPMMSSAAPIPNDGTDEPARNASTEVWRAFLANQHVEFGADASRADLIDLWDAHRAKA